MEKKWTIDEALRVLAHAKLCEDQYCGCAKSCDECPHWVSPLDEDEATLYLSGEEF